MPSEQIDQIDSSLWGSIRIILLGTIIILFIVGALFPGKINPTIISAVKLTIAISKLVLMAIAALGSLIFDFLNLFSGIFKFTPVDTNQMRTDAFESITQILSLLQSILIKPLEVPTRQCTATDPC